MLNSIPLDFISIFVIAFSAAISHCIGMCGGIVLVYSQLLKGSIFLKIASHFVYGFGRITTYCAIGAICAFIASGLSPTPSAKGGVFIIVGSLMILFGLAFLLLPKIVGFLEPNLANSRVFKWLFEKSLKSNNLFGIYILGILNGAIPCGIVYFFALSASVSGGVLNGIIIMLIFGLATLIPMVLLGIFSSLMFLNKCKNIISKISSILIIAFGIYTIFKGFKILFT